MSIPVLRSLAVAVRRHSLRVLVLAAVAWSMSACGEDPAAAGGGVEVPSKPVLTRVGPGVLEAHPGDEINLRALVANPSTGPLTDQAVKFRITEDPGGAALSAASGLSNARGLVESVLTVADEGTVTVKAEASGIDGRAIWRIDVQPMVKQLRAVASPGVTVAARGASARVSAVAGRSIPLRVRATAASGDNEEPIVGDRVEFRFQTSLQGARLGVTGPIQTSGSGEATVQLDPGTVVGSYNVVASLSEGTSVTFEVSVQQGTGGGQCQSSSQCPVGERCIAGTCQLPGGGGQGCGDDDRPCPLGYQCDKDTNQCEPAVGGACDACPDSNLSDGLHCENDVCVLDDPECMQDNDCPSGFSCRSGACAPADGSVDVTGHWYTSHVFDIQDALPGWARIGGQAIRIVDQAMLGQLGLPSAITGLIRDLVQQYIPEWVRQVVYILDNLATIFSQLRAEGEMDLEPSAGPQLLAGTETWNSFVFYLLAQCGQNIGGSTTNPPPCARVDIYASDLQAANLAADVGPFAARVGGSPDAATLLVDRRQVRLKLAGILKFVLDQLVQLTTGYPSLEGPPGHPEQGALANLIDCVAVNQFVQDLGVSVDVTSLCQRGVVSAGQAIARQLLQQVVKVETLQFDGQASVQVTDPLQPGYATELGYSDFTTRTPADGVWRGSFLNLVNNVPGRWHAVREAPLSP